MTSHRSLLEGQPETVDDRAHTATCHVRMQAWGVYTIYLYLYIYIDTHICIYIYVLLVVRDKLVRHVTNTGISLRDADIHFSMWVAGESRELIFVLFLPRPKTHLFKTTSEQRGTLQLQIFSDSGITVQSLAPSNLEHHLLRSPSNFSWHAPVHRRMLTARICNMESLRQHHKGVSMVCAVAANVLQIFALDLASSFNRNIMHSIHLFV